MPHVVTLAVGETLRSGVLTFAGNLFIAIFAVAALGFMLRRERVEAFAFLAVATIIGTVVYASEQWEGLFREVGGWIS